MTTPHAVPRIVRASVGDAVAIAALHAALFDNAWSTETFALMLTRDNVHGFVAVPRNQPAATPPVTLDDRPGEAEPPRVQRVPPPDFASAGSAPGWRGNCPPTPTCGLLGFVFVQTILDEAEIMSIGVARSAQRSGLGGALLQVAIRNASEAGARAVHLEVATTNAAACALYARHGFRQVGLRKGYYTTRDGRVDAMLMRTEIRA